MPTQCRCGLQSLGYDSCYWHTKSEVDWSAHPPASNGLSPEQRAFVGLFGPRPRDGWHSPDLEPYGPEDSNDYLTDADKRLLQVLCDPPSRGWGGEPDG